MKTGVERGCSVLDVLKLSQNVTKINFQTECVARRMGDLEKPVASAFKTKQALNWTPQFDDLKYTIIRAWAFIERQFQ
ncbi:MULTISPECIES: hypothetical protein [Thalassospira]|uniref:NAD(P)-binding domain-containing protein n=1 Tax=Thalassospira profundimaris TaxID=502049 RepID=A0A367VJX8_9PROT|nr:MULTISPECIES: hypothetical protein [Thalassospira]KZB70890.1 hypothetical protein AUQ43_08550 [Thalassospira sp. MCCC 1A01148]RCK25466.1 hypothetical protein TH6_02305 [Thalassospira profundimaris]